MFTYTTDGIVVENFNLFNIFVCNSIYFILFSFYLFLRYCYTLVVVYYILFWFVLFHFIMFIQLYPDVMGDYVMRLYDALDLLFYGRWNSHILFYFISFLFKYT